MFCQRPVIPRTALLIQQSNSICPASFSSHLTKFSTTTTLCLAPGPAAPYQLATSLSANNPFSTGAPLGGPVPATHPPMAGPMGAATTSQPAAAAATGAPTSVDAEWEMFFAGRWVVLMPGMLGLGSHSFHKARSSGPCTATATCLSAGVHVLLGTCCAR